MILADFLVKSNGGYYCRYGDFYIDPMEPVPYAVVSHAHGDHASPGHQYIHCTAPSAAFMQHRFSKFHRSEYRLSAYEQSFRIGDVELNFLPAGHILGSAQILMRYQGVSYLYTGDYKMQADPTCEPLKIVPADVLITESTFANPSVSHPSPVEEIKKLSQVSSNIMLGAYALGKAQRLTALINQYAEGKRILLHHGIIPMHRIYESFGFDLGPFELYNRRIMRQTTDKNHVYMVPPMAFRSYRRATDVVRVFASGWSHLQTNTSLNLFISDHVDWQDILQYVAQVNPREIWTVHGDGKYLSEHFAGTIPVRSL